MKKDKICKMIVGSTFLIVAILAIPIGILAVPILVVWNMAEKLIKRIGK